MVNTIDIRLSFEKKSYEVPEGNTVHTELVNILKDGGTVTERTLQVLVQLNPPAGFEDAVQGITSMHYHRVLF